VLALGVAVVVVATAGRARGFAIVIVSLVIAFVCCDIAAVADRGVGWGGRAARGGERSAAREERVVLGAQRSDTSFV
jgi:hypothetical protein